MWYDKMPIRPTAVAIPYYMQSVPYLCDGVRPASDPSFAFLFFAMHS